jgi:hypothetical protein
VRACCIVATLGCQVTADSGVGQPEHGLALFALQASSCCSCVAVLAALQWRCCCQHPKLCRWLMRGSSPLTWVCGGVSCALIPQGAVSSECVPGCAAAGSGVCVCIFRTPCMHVHGPECLTQQQVQRQDCAALCTDM